MKNRKIMNLFTHVLFAFFWILFLLSRILQTGGYSLLQWSVELCMQMGLYLKNKVAAA